MSANFPNSPTLNQVFNYNSSSWFWNGRYWQAQDVPEIAGATGITGATGATGPTGLGFSIAKIYANVATLTADVNPAGILAGQFAIIETGNVEDLENSRLYLWTGNSYVYTSDLSGAQGIQGPSGATGLSGPVGATGSTGIQGQPGATGLLGPVGATGSTGIQGQPGATGSTGADGVAGATGATGTAGPAGVSANVSVYDEGNLLVSQLHTINFIGPGITANAEGSNVTVTVTATGTGGFHYTNVAPISPTVGDRWVNSDSLREFVYINDGDTNQWIETVRSSQIGATGATGPGANLSAISGNLVPAANLTYDIGTESLRWRDLYLSGNTIYLGAATLGSNGSAITLPSGTRIGNTPVATTADVATIATGVAPKVANVQVTDETWTVLDDTAISTGGGYILVNGTGYISNPQVYVNNVPASAVTFVSNVQLRVQVPATAAGTYPLYVINPDGGTAIMVPGISFSGVPAWSTGAGSLATAYELGAVNSSLSASSNSTVSYYLASGSLPPGVSINTAAGTLTGNTEATASSTTYNFSIEARDLENQSTLRAFSITVNPDVVSWATPADNTTVSVYEYASVNQALAATAATGRAVSFSSANLPTGLSVSGNNIVGTATVVANTATIVTATSANTLRTANRTINFAVSQDTVTWSTPSNAAVITGYEFGSVSQNLSATSAAGRAVSYSGTGLPANVAVTGSTVAGNLGAVGNTSSTLTATAATTNRSSNIAVTFQAIPDVVSWATPAANSVISITAGSTVTQALSATSAAGRSITYTANNLPTGLAVSGSTVTGTPTGYTSSTTVSGNLTATAAVTNRSATISVTWSISLAAIFAAVTDPLFGNVSLLLNATANASVISDAGPNNFQLTPYGDVRASSFSPYQTGWSAYFDGSGDNLAVSDPSRLITGFGTGDWTIECWFYGSTSGAATYQWYFNTYLLYSYNNTIIFYKNAVGDLLSTSVLPNTWYHCAVVKASGVHSMYVNGVRTSTTWTDNTSITGDTTFTIGSGATANYWQGYISNLRVVKGLAVYTSNFTPPTVPLTAIPNTSLLTCRANRFVDSSSNNFAITRNGDVRVESFNPFNLVNTGTTGSMYLDGSGDYLQTVTDTAFQFGTGDFTLEAWVYLTAYSTNSFSPVLDLRRVSPNYVAPCMEITQAGKLTMRDGSTGTNPGGLGSTTLVLNQWYHIAITRASSTVRYFVNGQSDVTPFNNTTNYNSTVGLTIGESGDNIGAGYSFKGYIADARVTKGRAIYPATFPDAALPATANTSILITGSGVNNATNNVFLDSSSKNNTITRNGNTTQGTFSPFSNGGWSIHSAGTSNGGSRLDIGNCSSLFGSGVSYTFDGWFMFTTNSSGDNLNLLYAGTWPNRFLIDADTGTSTGNIRLRCFNESNSVGFSSGYTPYTLGSWVHIAGVNNSVTSTFTFYVNGKSVGSNAAIYFNSYATLSLLYNSSTVSGTHPLYAASVRLVNGQALTTNNFAGPTGPLTANSIGWSGPTVASSITGTIGFIITQSNRFVDNGPSARPITVAGDIRVQAFSPFPPTTYSATANGGSAYFDGSGDYLATPATNQFVASGDFTLSFWVYSTNTNQMAIIGNHANTSTTSGNWFIAVSAGLFEWYVNGGAGAAQIYGGAYVPGQWHYAVLARSGSTVTAYLNGSAVGTMTKTDNFGNSGQTYHIGQRPYPGSPVSYTGYVADVRFVNGFAIPGTTIPTVPATAVYGTELLLSFTNSGIRDEAGRVNFETVADAKLSTLQSRYYPSSMYFDGTGDYLQAIDSPLFDFGTGDFTVEAWAFPTVISSDHYIFSMNTATGDAGHFSINIYQNNWRAGLFNNYMPVNGTVSASSALNTWTHVALVRLNNTLYFYVNGVSIGTPVSVSGVAINCTSVFRIGGYSISVIPFTGYVSDFRISRTALYTTSFSVPAAPLSAVQNTSLLTLQNSQPHNNHTFRDSSAYNHLITRSGNATQGTFSPFSPAGWSVYADGSSTLYAPDHSSYPSGTQNFCVECFYYHSSPSTNNYLISKGGSIQESFGIQFNAGANAIRFYSHSVATVKIIDAYFGTPITGAWNHVAAYRIGNNFYGALNGRVTLLGTTSDSVQDNAAYVGIMCFTGTASATAAGTGYIHSVRITAGTGIYGAGDFAVPSAPLSASVSGGTVALLTCQSNRFIDLSTNNHSLVASGAKVQSFSPVPVNAAYSAAIHGGSAYFDRTGDFLSLGNNNSFNFSGNFTVELWYYPLAYDDIQIILSGTSNYQFGYSAFDSRNLYYYGSSGNTISGTPASSMLINQWNHIVLVRSGTTLSIMSNGVRQGTATHSSSVNFSGSTTIGGYADSTTSYAIRGYLAGFRAVNGVAVYDPTQTTYTVPTAPPTATTTTSLLLNFTADAVEDSTGRNVVETVGDARHSRAVTKFANTSSMWFDGTGDQVVVSPVGTPVLGNGSWTVEFWTFMPTVPSTGAWVARFSTGTGFFIRSLTGQGSGIQVGWSGAYVFGSNGSSVGTLYANRWHHIALIKSGTNAVLYIDGINVASTSSWTWDENLSTPFTIGSTYSGSEYFTGYIQDLRITRGVARYQPAAPTANLSITNNTVLSLSNLNQGNFVTKDSSVNNAQITVFGDSRATNFTPYGTGWSVYFDGNADYLTIPPGSAFAYGTGAFTLEAWIYRTALGPAPYYGGVIFTQAASSNNYFHLAANADNKIDFIYTNTALTSTRAISFSTWTHIAVVREGTGSNQFKLYINGIVDTVSTVATNFTDTSLTVSIGDYSHSQIVGFAGYISDLRLVKGTAVYTTNFIPPTAPLEAIAGTSLLTCQSNRFRDSSTNNFTVTRYNNASVQSYNPFNLTNTGTAGSMYFDGTGDYLNLPAGGMQGSWTIELWWYPMSTGPQTLMSALDAANAVRINAWCNNNQLIIDNGAVGQSAFTTVSLVPYSWNHVVFVRNGTTTSGYINGQLAGSNSFTPGANITQFRIASNLSVYYVTGYISNFRVVDGTAVYTSAFTPTTTPLTAIANTRLLTLQYKQPHNNNYPQDSSANQWLVKRYNNISTTSNSPYWGTGYYSTYHGGPYDYIYISDNSAVSLGGTQSFTAEIWASFSGYGAGNGWMWLFGHGNTGGAGNFIFIKNNGSAASNVFRLYINGGDRFSFTVPIELARWYHFAVVREGADFYKLFMDGQLMTSGTYSYTIPDNWWCVGSVPWYNNLGMVGNLSNHRVVVGRALYSGNFNVPTEPLSSVPGTRVLMNASPMFRDDSPLKWKSTGSMNGDYPNIHHYSPFPIAAYNPTQHGGSVYFDGVADYLELPASTMFQFGSRDFTIELWLYLDRNDDSNTVNLGFHWNGTSSGTVTGSTRIHTRCWTHVAVTRSGTVLNFWVDGRSDSGNPKTVSATIYNNNDPLYIGRGADHTASGNSGRDLLHCGETSGAANKWFFYLINCGTGYFLGYMSDIQIHSYVKYTQAFTPSLTAPVIDSLTNLLIRGNEAAIVDFAGKYGITTQNEARLANFGPFMTNYSVYFDGSGDYLNAPDNASLQMGTGDFTVECWIYPTAFPGGSNYGSFIGGGAASALLVSLNGAGTAVTVNPYGSGFTAIGNFTFSLNVWYHIASTRAGTSLRLFVNGAQVASAADSYNYAASTRSIGALSDGGQPFTGYISNLRIVKGTALYTANFTPATSALSGAGASLLTCASNRFRDLSTNNFAITSNGDARIVDFNPFSNQTASLPSIYFDGTTDGLKCTVQKIWYGSGDLMNFNTDQFTMECWFYSQKSSNEQILMGFFNANNYGIGLTVHAVAGGARMLNGNGSWNVIITSSSNSFAINTWNHVAMVRYSNTWTLYLNGVSVGTTSQSAASYYLNTQSFRVGGNIPGLSGYDFQGYIADVKVHRRAVYGAFEPATQPFPNR